MRRTLEVALRVAAVLAIAAAPATATAEVVDAAAGGFTVRTVLDVGAPPDEVYSALTENVGSWWDPAHTYSGDAARLSIDARPGGCFCERLDAGGVQHMEVVFASHGVRLRLEGGLGPLQAEAVTGHLSWDLEATESGARLTLTYKVVGYAPGGLEAWAAPVDSVLSQAATRLVRFVETGKPG
ncbi:MAG: ATPase [Thermoanaerobaculia bacterium]|nr:ATPase [Thermoanaerobaculia bacterium]